MEIRDHDTSDEACSSQHALVTARRNLKQRDCDRPERDPSSLEECVRKLGLHVVKQFGPNGGMSLYVYNLWCPGIGVALRRLPFGYRSWN